MDGEGVADVAFLELLEVLGDWEDGSKQATSRKRGIHCDDRPPEFYVGESGRNRDDESCTCHSSDPHVRAAKRRGLEGKERYGDDRKMEERSVCVTRQTRYPIDEEVGNLQNPAVTVDSRDEEQVKEMEQNRLFWEACLAS